MASMEVWCDEPGESLPPSWLYHGISNRNLLMWSIPSSRKQDSATRRHVRLKRRKEWEETYYQASDLPPHSSFPQPMEMLGGEVHFHQHIGNEAKDGILYARCRAFP